MGLRRFRKRYRRASGPVPAEFLVDEVTVLRALGGGQELRLDDAAVRQALYESRSGLDDLDRLRLPSRLKVLSGAADRLGMRLTRQTLSLKQLPEFPQSRFPLVVPVREGAAGNLAAWLLITEWEEDEVRLEGGLTVDVSELLQVLQVESIDDEITFLAASHALPCEPVEAAPYDFGGKDQEHGEEEPHPSPLRRLYLLLRPERKDIGAVSVFAAMVSVLSLATPVAVEALVNVVSFGRYLTPLIVISVILLVGLGLGAALRVLQTYFAEIIQERLFVRVVADLSYRIPRVRQTMLDGRHAPELLNRFFDVMTVQKSAALLILDGIMIVMQTLVGMILLTLYHPYLLGFDLLLIASQLFVIFVLGKGAVSTAIDESKAKYAVAAWLEELFHFQLTFKSRGGPQRAIERADRLATDYITLRREHFRVLIRQISFSLGLQAIAGSLLLGLAGWLVMQGRLSLGQLVAAELIVAILFGSFAKLGKHMESFYDLLAAVDKLGHLFDMPVERATGYELVDATQGIAVGVHDVSYTYEESEVTVRNLNLQMDPGEIVAITGPAGSGKSLLLDLLYGLRHPEDGYVELDGEDTRGLHTGALREQVSLVRQNELFSGTLRENLQLNSHTTSTRPLRELLQRLEVYAHVQALPDGLDTQVSPPAGSFSFSVAQRLTLARALLGRPRLLLIDGTLDDLATKELAIAVEELRARRDHTTVLIATNRVEVMELCDRVVTFADPYA